MARTQYVVTRKNGQWWIRLEGKDHGPYGSQADAIRVAVDTAHKNGTQGRDSQVLVQGEDNQFRTEWTYGHDPYPPRG